MKRPDSYNTKKSRAILEYIESLQGEHVTACRIAEYFAKTGTPVGLTTVYRQLDKLVERGCVRKYAGGLINGEAAACYQFVRDNCEGLHFHMKCEECGELLHLECEILDRIKQHIIKEHNFVINPMKTVFYGTHAGCTKAVKERQSY